MPADGPRSDDRLQLELRGPVDPVPVDDDVIVDVALANVGADPVVVNRRLLVAPHGSPAVFHELELRVDGPAGYVNRKVVQVNAGRPRPQDFGPLDPGERVEKRVRLTQFHTLDVPGTYTVRASYSNSAAAPDSATPAWTGELESEPCVIERR